MNDNIYSLLNLSCFSPSDFNGCRLVLSLAIAESISFAVQSPNQYYLKVSTHSITAAHQPRRSLMVQCFCNVAIVYKKPDKNSNVHHRYHQSPSRFSYYRLLISSKLCLIAHNWYKKITTSFLIESGIFLTVSELQFSLNFANKGIANLFLCL